MKDGQTREAASRAAAAAIECKNISYRYPNLPKGAPHAIEQVNFAVDTGELVAIIGHTGSGKSTLIQHLNALLKPQEGMVFVDGKNIWENKSAVRAARFVAGLCFQYPEHQLFEETVEKDIAFGPRNMGLPKEEVHRRVREAAAFVGLDASLLPKSPFDLSGGEKRRAAIAGVLAMEPRVLVLDEPTAGLDPQGRERVLQMILRYRAQTGKTILLVSHNMEDVARLAGRVLVMHRGRAAMYGTVEEVFAQAGALNAMGLTVPSVTRIFLRLREMGLPVRDGVFTMEQGIAELLRLRAEGEKEVSHD
ncbi:MAG: energy-coupling factor transporter ATPase [Oscillospiraceae bacterium]|nr:energy-coupling factor transporter ATPase [Oscillospiraceae bacterium]